MRENRTWTCTKGSQGKYRDVTFTYQGCGVIEPRTTQWGSMRRACACEIAAEKLYNQRKAEEERQEWIRQQITNTYNWLGSSWHNMALAKKTFATFNQQHQRAAYKIARAFVDVLSGTFVLHGTFGTGKTHLLSAICNELRERDEKPLSSRFLTSLDMFNAIQSCIANHQSYDWILSRASATPLLVIDDLDKAKRSDFREEVYFSIIDKRVQNDLPIALSTNRLADLPEFVGQACFSRLRVGLIEIEMVGEDYRGRL